MSQEPPVKSVRKGAKSCIECRHHKVRCVWLAEGADSCQRCLAHGRKCESQIYMVPTSTTVTATSRARITKLESEVSSLWNALHNLEVKLGCSPTETGTHAPPSSGPGNAAGLLPKPSDADSDTDASDLSPVNPPSHLLQLFDNGLLDSHESSLVTSLPHVSRLHNVQRSNSLREFLPSRRDMFTITAHATSWLSLHNALFPMANVTKSSDEMLLRYDALQDPDADPVAIAALLLCIAITVQQSPDDTAGRVAQSIKDASAFVRDVSDTVERTIISDDALSASIPGIELTLLFIRLQLGRGRVKKMWLLKKRIIALAELVGLPRSSLANASHQEPLDGSRSHQDQSGTSPVQPELWKRKAELWESICAVDRITSMMWSLPLSTKDHPLPKLPIIGPQGQVDPKGYLYSLVEIAGRVIELDSMYSCNKPVMELFNVVMENDRELRTLSSLTPKDWRKIHWTELSIDAILQFWHQYLTVRTHLQLALKHYEGQEFAYNFVTCLDACQDMAKRYTTTRPVLPGGFFANRVIDLQAFTAVVFLLLVSYRATYNSGTSLLPIDISATTTLVDQAIQMMEFVSSQPGGNFARQAADAIRSLNTLLQQPQTSEIQDITLNLVLVGRIRVSRKSVIRKMATQLYPPPGQQPQEPMQPAVSNDDPAPASPDMSFRLTGADMMDSLSYSMEVPENHPFLMDEAFATEQWLTWTGWDS